MPLVFLFRWFKGIVHFSVEGDIECFLNLVAKIGIQLFSIKLSENGLTASCFKSDESRVLSCTQKTGCVICIKRKMGFPFIFKRYKKRIGVFVGIALFLAVVIISSQFIWTIDIKGNETLTRDEIISALAEIGVKTGSFMPSLDAKMLEEKLLLSLDKLSWCAINLQGSTAFIELKERDYPPEMQTDETPCNIIAKKSGVIRKIEVYEGQSVVMEGEAVSEGTLIISGIIETKKGNTYLKHANALVLAEVEYPYTIEVPFKEQVSQKTGNTHSRYYINLVGHRIPLWFYKNIESCEITEQESSLSIFGAQYPIGIVKEICDEVVYVENELSLAEVKKRAKSQLAQKIEDELAGREIVKKSFSGEQQKDKYIIKGYCTVLEDIGKIDEILIKNP